MKKTLLILLMGVMGVCQQVDATQPLRRVYAVQQNDGTYLNVQKAGNGKFMFYVSQDGMALLRGENGNLEYAMTDRSGLVASGMCAHEVEARTADEYTHLRAFGVKAEDAYRQLVSRQQKMTRGMGNGAGNGLVPFGQPGSGIVKSIGAPEIPVIMVEFPDCKFMEGTTKDKVSRMLNEKGYDDEKFCKGSVKDYFVSQSAGLFNPTYTVVAKVLASHPYAYYGKNGAGSSIDLQVKSLIREALDLANASGVDFKKFAKDNGRVPLVSVYYAGPGEHSAFEEGSEDYIWAHFSETSFTVNGVGINSYFVGNEVMQDYEKGPNGEPIVSVKNFDGIGIFVHEFGHALGLPDFYQTRGAVKVEDTPDFWSVMDYGQYCYNGYAPMGYSAFERSSLGWLKMKELKTSEHVTLLPFSMDTTKNVAYYIVNEKNEKEYFIFENRQLDTWYPKEFGHGMLITHVDYDQNVWAYNNVNNDPKRQRYEVVPADNVKSGYRDTERRDVDWDFFKADLFPGIKGAVEFTDNSIPAAKVHTGGLLGKPVYNIAEKNGVVTFDFMDAEITGIEGVGTTDEWSDNTEIYSISGQRIAAGTKLRRGVYLLKDGDKVRKIYVK